MNVAVIGLGRLGLPMLAVFAEAGHRVVGLDIDEGRIADLQNGKQDYVDEPGLDEILTRVDTTYTTDYADISGADYAFVVVNTPPIPSGRLDSSQITSALNSIEEMKYPPEDVVITSTTQPGDMEYLANQYPVLKLIYQPQFIALGTVIDGLWAPDMALYGVREDQPRPQELQVFWETVYLSPIGGPPVFVTNYTNAELIKISLNAYLCTKIAFMNSLAEYCEMSDNADANIVLEGLDLDSRVNSCYMKPGMGYGGTCFPKDLEAYNYALDKKTSAFLTKYIPRINQYHNKRFADLASWTKTAAVLGLTYKPGVPVRERAQADDLIVALRRVCEKVKTFDPSCKLGKIYGKAVLDNVEDCATMEEAVKDAGIVFICTAWPEFRDLKFDGPIVDCCGLGVDGEDVILPGRSFSKCSGRIRDKSESLFQGQEDS